MSVLTLIPKDDRKQRIRTERALQAIYGGSIQSLVSVVIFLAGGFRLDPGSFALMMILLWAGHLALFLTIRFSFNKRFNDPSMTREMVIWAILTLLITVFFMDRYRPLMMMFFPIILIYGAFRMTPRQYVLTAALMILGYFLVVIGIHGSHPDGFLLRDEMVVGGAFVLVIIAFSSVSNQISLFRKKLYQRNRELATAMQKIEQMAITDELTGLINRRHMMYMLNRQKALADRGGDGFCVCFFDIDRFKTINDTLGHPIGDTVLKRFASTIKPILRTADLFSRFGGEEFVFMGHGVDLGGTQVVANRIREATEKIDFSDLENGMVVTISGGVAQYRNRERIEATLSRADKALYLAKSSGRNCIKLETDG